MKRRLAGLLAAACGAAAAVCPPPGESKASLAAYRAAEWKQPADEAQRQALALALLDCLSDPDPALRDLTAFDALQYWLRTGGLNAATQKTLRERLLAMVAAPPDPAGFTQPFAALVLSEVARTDRIRAHFSEAEFAAQVAAATRWLAGWQDWRAFDDTEGWRHGVAHGADWLLQLALNPRLTKPQAEAILAAVAVQVMPPGTPAAAVAYRHGEPDRLAATVYYLAQGAQLAPAEWERWLLALAARRERTPHNAATLAQKHNLSAFLNSLYVATREVGSPELQARLLPGLKKALREAE